MHEFITLREFCRRSGYSRQRLYQLWREGAGPLRQRVKDARGRWIVRLPRDAALQWLLEHRERVGRRKPRRRGFINIPDAGPYLMPRARKVFRRRDWPPEPPPGVTWGVPFDAPDGKRLVMKLEPTVRALTVYEVL